jgi:hypothetical protein
MALSTNVSLDAYHFPYQWCFNVSEQFLHSNSLYRVNSFIMIQVSQRLIADIEGVY